MDFHMLVVDDDEMSHNLYRHIFNTENYKVSNASDGMNALTLKRSNLYFFEPIP